MAKTVSFRPSDKDLEKLTKMAEKKKWSVALLVKEIVTNVINPIKK